MYDIYNQRVFLRNVFILNNIYYDITLDYLNWFLYFLYCFLSLLFIFDFFLLGIYFYFAIKGCLDVKIYRLFH